MVSAWPEPPNAMSAEKSAGVHDGVEAALLLRGRAITARDDVQLQRAVLIEAGLNHGCTDESLASLWLS
jgi:hypothetical protein